MAKASDNEFPSILFDEQASAPTTPATGFWRAYFKSDGLYVVDDAGTETGPLAASASPAAFVGAKAAASATTSANSATWTAKAYAAADTYDTDGFHDPASNNTRMTIPVGKGGTYRVGGLMEFAANTTGDRGMRFIVNGATTHNVALLPSTKNAASWRYSGTIELALSAGDYIEHQGWQDSGGALNMATGCTFWLEKIG